jgi:hypothetical protein
MGCDPFRIDHGFIAGNIQVQVLLVPLARHASKGSALPPPLYGGGRGPRGLRRYHHHVPTPEFCDTP